MNDEFNMRIAVSRLSTENVVRYLRARGWQQKPSRNQGRFYFEGEIHYGGEPHQLYLPASRDVPKYRKLLHHAIYFLCGVEDREPSEIIGDILSQHDTRPEQIDSKAPRIRVRNRGRSPLVLKITSRGGEHWLLPEESIELVCDQPLDGTLEIEHTDTSMTIRDGGSQGGQ